MIYPYTLHKAKIKSVEPSYPNSLWDYRVTFEYTKAVKARSVLEIRLPKILKANQSPGVLDSGILPNKTMTKVTFTNVFEIGFPLSKIIKEKQVQQGDYVNLEAFLYTVKRVFEGKVYYRQEIFVSLFEKWEKKLQSDLPVWVQAQIEAKNPEIPFNTEEFD